MAKNDDPQHNGNSCIDCDILVNWKTEDVFENYLKEEVRIKDLLQSAESDVKVKCTTLAGKAKLRNIKYTEFALARENIRIYTGLEHCVTVFALEEAAHIKQTSLDIKAAKQEIVTAMNLAADAIKVSKDKAKAAAEAACKLEACMNDSCNAEQLSILRKLKIKKGDLIGDNKNGGKPGPPTKGENATTVDFDTKVREIIKCIKEGGTSTDKIFEQSVQLASILAGINADNLVVRSEALYADVDNLKKNIAGNKEDAGKAEIESANQYNQGLTSFVAAFNAVSKSTYSKMGLEIFKTKLCELKNKPGCNECKSEPIKELEIPSGNEICPETPEDEICNELPEEKPDIEQGKSLSIS